MEPDVVVSPFAKPRAARLAPGSIAGAALLMLLFAVGVTVLGGARTWILLPMFGLLAGLLLLQVGRLAAGPGIGVGRLLRPDVIDGFAFLFLVYAGIRYATAPVEYAARIEWLTILSGAVCFWTARYGMARSSHGLLVLGGIVAIAFAEALFSIWYSFNPSFRVWGESLNIHYWPRFLGSFGCPNHYGAFLYMGAFSALALALFMPGRMGLRLLLLLAAVTMSFGVAFSLSRGSWIGFFFGFSALAVFCAHSGKIAWKSAAAAVGGVVLTAGVWAAFSPDVQGRLAEIADHVATFGGNPALDGYVRIVLARDAWRIIGDYFWLGAGPGAFAFLHPRYQDAKYDTLAIFTHNDYLNTWCDYGFVGFLLAFGFVVAVTAGLWLRVRRAKGREEAKEEGENGRGGRWAGRALLGAGLASWTALTLHEAVDFNFHIPVCAFAGLTIAGLALRANGRGAAPILEGRAMIRAARIAAAVGALLAYFFVAQVTRTAKGYYPFHRVEVTEGDEVYPVAESSLSESLRADPQSWETQALLADYERAEALHLDEPQAKAEMSQKAIESYLRAIELNPYDDGLLVRLGLAYDGMNRYAEAYIAYSKAIARRPYNGFYHAYLGLHFWRQGGEENLAFAEKEFETGKNCPYGKQVAFDYQKQLLQYRQALEAQTAKAAQTPAAEEPTTKAKEEVPAASVPEASAGN